jgi:quinol monooxygenase YgiN
MGGRRRSRSPATGNTGRGAGGAWLTAAHPPGNDGGGRAADARNGEAGVTALVARLKVREGKAEEFITAARAMVAAVARAEAGRTLTYTLLRARDDPNTFLFYEQYADADALAAHGQTEHMRAFGAALRDLLDGRAQVERYDIVATLDG